MLETRTLAYKKGKFVLNLIPGQVLLKKTSMVSVDSLTPGFGQNSQNKEFFNMSQRINKSLI